MRLDVLRAVSDIYIYLREFVYSRHPDPRRVWKGGSEQHLLTPLPRAPRAPRTPRAPRANSKKLCFVDCFVNLTRLSVFDINLFTWNFTSPVYNRRFRRQIATPLVYNRK